MGLDQYQGQPVRVKLAIIQANEHTAH